MTLHAITPEGWPRGAGYAHAVAGEGRILCLAGQIGWDPVTQTLAGADFITQAEQALANVAALLRAADAGPEHLARLTWYITDRAAYHNALAQLGAVYRRQLGRNFPAMAVVVVAALLEPGALVEVEATAII